MDRQAIFNTAYIGLAKQGFETSLGIGGDCQYRGEDGLKCAIGHCISDDDYLTSMEHVSPTGATHEGAIIRDLLGAQGESYDDDAKWLGELQRVHDAAPGPSAMKAALHDFAAEHSLTIPEIEAAK